MPLMAPPPAALAVLRSLREAGFEAYFCGGCVRDALMGRPPKDWDIATSAPPDGVEALFDHTIPVGKAFGVILVVVDDTTFEVATFRTDLGYDDGRRPRDVRFASAREDAARRDFTINALFYDPDADRVIDYVGGQADIREGRLRTVGDPAERFGEDHLRLVRAVRFAGRTGFRLEAGTRQALERLADRVRTVASERIAAELVRMLTEGYARAAFELLEETGLLARLLPEVAAMRGVEQPPRFHPEGDVLTHTFIMLELMDGCMRGAFEEGLRDLPASVPSKDDRKRGMCPSPMTPEERLAAVKATWEGVEAVGRPVLGFAVLLHDVGKPPTFTRSDRIRFNEHDKMGADMAVKILERLKRPRQLIEAVEGLIGRHIHLANLRKMRQAKLRRWLQDPLFPLHLELHRLDCESSHRMLANYAFGYAAWQVERARPPERAPLLTGKDLLAMGFAPGPQMGEILRVVADARLEGALSTPKEAQAFVRARYRP
jgi:hypothetical protein